MDRVEDVTNEMVIDAVSDASRGNATRHGEDQHRFVLAWLPQRFNDRVPLSPSLTHARGDTSAAMPITTLDLSEVATDATTRHRLSNLSLSVAKCKKILVVTGAGISCSCGIPVRVFPKVTAYCAHVATRLRRTSGPLTGCMHSSSSSILTWS